MAEPRVVLCAVAAARAHLHRRDGIGVERLELAPRHGLEDVAERLELRRLEQRLRPRGSGERAVSDKQTHVRSSERLRSGAPVALCVHIHGELVRAAACSSTRSAAATRAEQSRATRCRWLRWLCVCPAKREA